MILLKKITLIFASAFILTCTLSASQLVYWNNPVFVNMTFLKIYYINIKDEMAGDILNLSFGEKASTSGPFLLPLGSKTFDVKTQTELTFPGESEQPSFTTIKVNISGVDNDGITCELNSTEKYDNFLQKFEANYYFWENIESISSKKSYITVFFDINDFKYKLHLYLKRTNGDQTANYYIPLALKLKKGNEEIDEL
jgi:hypothetical protein